jgi:adenine-specific DNA-methyltransferase
LRSVFIEQSSTVQKGFSDTSGWVILSPIEARIKEKIEAVGIPLKDWDIKIYRGVLTGYNEAFIIDEDTKNKLIDASPKNAEIIRPILKGRDIKNYYCQFENRYIIFAKRGIDIDDYQAVKDYLSTYHENLKPRSEKDTIGRKPGSYQWFEIQDNVAYYRDFYKEKIIWIELSDMPKFAYDKAGYFVEATAFIMTGSHLQYLTAFLNSPLCDWYFDKITTTSGVGTNRWKKVYIEELRVPLADPDIESAFKKTFDLLQANNFSESIRDCLNEMVYDLYDFAADEKEIINSFRKNITN